MTFAIDVQKITFWVHDYCTHANDRGKNEGSSFKIEIHNENDAKHHIATTHNLLLIIEWVF